MLCRILGECRPALAVVCPLFSDNGGQLHLLYLLGPIFLNNVGQLVMEISFDLNGSET